MRQVIKPDTRPVIVQPRVGDIRRIRKFLWLPKTMARWDGVMELRWLETAEIEQEYEPNPSVENRKRLAWTDKKWLN